MNVYLIYYNIGAKNIVFSYIIIPATNIFWSHHLYYGAN